MTTTKSYPLVFTFPDVIVGKGFVAAVEVHGRALLVEDPAAETWLYGVQPGGVAGGGGDSGIACREFKKGYLSVLFDLAEESATFDDFKKVVQEFFETVNVPNSAAWDEALVEIRKNSASVPGLPTVKAESHPPTIKIDRLSQETMRPTKNRFDEVLKAA